MCCSPHVEFYVYSVKPLSETICMFLFLAEGQYDEREILLSFLLATPLSPFKDLQCPLEELQMGLYNRC